ncbi:ribose 1,5-bisphosphate phosphokinase PhnN [Azorhizobium oxalatiphilum]|uniref:Ribose 1,5-bisphosphate phosphokinase PhnN n=1 Tax=Azorhizobium oxalatiphilum TaxID=980631 RepID=A0A917BKH0_9HYPH|nr:phosphonate metabolism protein/1,5-bisphosphokinase (PRPP-forming) PhnN [Azorhizobium oxalatiphilum]GGF49494.1 ribose 1,5-bisphosphate phosphokinase PhnN [Azorhizobium oxalatiphilum]
MSPVRGTSLKPPFGPGALVLVVGPSGAGKDTLMSEAARLLTGDTDLLVARRLVTRTDTTGEDHQPVDLATFEAELAAGRYPLAWRAHGLAYALGAEVAEALAQGRTVMANGSRATLPEARKRFSRLSVVHITAPPEVRAVRLAARGRESEDDIRERLARAPDVPLDADLEIQNVGPIREGAQRLADFIRAASYARAPEVLS